MQMSYIVIQRWDFVHEYNRVRPCFVPLPIACVFTLTGHISCVFLSIGEEFLYLLSNTHAFCCK